MNLPSFTIPIRIVLCETSETISLLMPYSNLAKLRDISSSTKRLVLDDNYARSISQVAGLFDVLHCI